MGKEKTPFGNFFQNLRKSHKQKLQDASQFLGVSISYICAVEYGEREIPLDWEKKIIQQYSLNDEEISSLRESILLTPTNKKFSLQDINVAFTNMINNMNLDEESRHEQFKNLELFLKSLKK